MAVSTINSDIFVNGSFAATGFTLPAGAVADSNVSATGTPIDSDKLQHLHKPGTNFGLEADAAPATSTTYTFTIYVAKAAATLRNFQAQILDLGTQDAAKQFAFELKKVAAGSSSSPATMLSAAISLDSANTDNTLTTATLASTAIAAGDMLIAELVTADTVTGLHGPWCFAEIDENAG